LDRQRDLVSAVVTFDACCGRQRDRFCEKIRGLGHVACAALAVTNGSTLPGLRLTMLSIKVASAAKACFFSIS